MNAIVMKDTRIPDLTLHIKCVGMLARLDYRN